MHDESEGIALPGYQLGTPEYRRVTISFFLAGLTIYASLYAPQPILPLLSEAFGITPAHASLSVSFSTIAIAGALLFAGPLADALGRKPVMIFTMLACSIVGIAAALVPQFNAFLGFRLLLGLAAAGLPATAIAYLSEEIDHHHLGAAMGLYIAGNSIGGLSGRIISGTLADLLDWRAAIGSIGVISLVCTLFFVRLLPASRNFKPQPLQIRQLGSSLVQAVQDPLLRILYGMPFMLMGSFVTLYNYISYQLMAPPYNLSATLVGWIFLMFIFGTFSSAVMGSLSDHHGRIPMLTLSVAIQLAGALLTLAAPLWLKVIGIAVFTFGYFGAHSIASGWVGHRASHHKSTASSLYLFTYYVGSSFAGTLGGIFWVAYGWSGVILFICAMLLICLGLVGLAARQVRQEEPAPEPGMQAM